MNTSDEFFQKMIENNIVFSKEDYENFMKICNNNVENFEICFKNYDNKNYKLSKSFFGKVFVHPKNMNPYTVKYKISDIIWELKLHNQKLNNSDKLNKLINYINYLN